MIFDELNVSIGTILECTCFKDDLIQCKCLCCKKNCQQKFDEHLKERLSNRSRFTAKISLFHCFEKMFILMKILVIGKNSMEHHYLKKKIFIVT